MSEGFTYAKLLELQKHVKETMSAEAYEIMRFGEVMYRYDENGNRIHVPREQWRADYNPKDK